MRRKILKLVGLLMCLTWGVASVVACGEKDGEDTLVPTEGLKYELNEEGDGYTVNTISWIVEGELIGPPVNVVIPYTYEGLPVTSIGIRAFYNSYDLKKIVIPDTVISIGHSAFNGCYKLKDMELPNSIKSIGSRAFFDCDSLERVIIPDTVTSIGEQAFVYCDGLTIYCEAESQPEGWDSHWNPSNCPVYWYSEDKPAINGNYWHYNKKGKIAIW